MNKLNQFYAGIYIFDAAWIEANPPAAKTGGGALKMTKMPPREEEL